MVSGHTALAEATRPVLDIIFFGGVFGLHIKFTSN